jgi:hypothetical protein
MLAKKLLAATGLVFLMSTAALARDPVGESADYKVDRNSARTSSMILSGSMTATVTQYMPDHPDGPAYEGKLDYLFKIQFMGNQEGTEYVNTPEEYFTPEFIARLRTDGTYESPQFKIRHQGYADARNLDGGFYPHCDKILIYDIKQEESAGFAALAKSLLGTRPNDPSPDDSIENLEIVAHVYQGVPVLGAVKLDVKGVYNGMNVKAGADYEAP